MSFDSARGRVVLFGGFGSVGFGGEWLSDTWEWDGSSWTNVMPAASPSARSGHAMAFSSSRGRTVLFGGSDLTNDFSDTWEWDGGAWRSVTPAANPFPRDRHAMVFDSARRRLVLFGGYQITPSETWEFDVPLERVCDGLDDNGNGLIDEGCDDDGDGYCDEAMLVVGSPAVCPAGGGDCDDTNPVTHPGAAEICDGSDNDCDGQVDEGLGSSSCGVGVCARTVSDCVGGAAQMCVPGPARAEACNGLDDNCNGQIDEGNPGGGAACDTGQPGICSVGTTLCRDGAIICVASAAPRPEVCNGLDDDCDGVADDITAGSCTLFVTQPLDGDLLDCSSPTLTPPTIMWRRSAYDRFEVFIGTDPIFNRKNGISSGESPLLSLSIWQVPKTRWVKLCKKASNGGSLYITIKGIDRDLRAKDPQRQFLSPTVTVSVHK
jgi:hypothetical protein